MDRIITKSKTNVERIILIIVLGIVVMYGIHRFTDNPIPVDVQKDLITQDSLINKTKEDVINYEERKAERVKQIKQTNDEKAKKIDDIPNLNTRERDSLWTILLTSKDSIPRRYWDILEKRTRRKSSGSF